jgi:hypothetical protein
MHRPEVNPTALPNGTRVGSWRVSGYRGRGVYGTVYSVLPEHGSLDGPAALKLAIHPADSRSAREVELLSRLGAHSPQAKPRTWLPWLAAHAGRSGAMPQQAALDQRGLLAQGGTHPRGMPGEWLRASGRLLCPHLRLLTRAHFRSPGALRHLLEAREGARHVGG